MYDFGTDARYSYSWGSEPTASCARAVCYFMLSKITYLCYTGTYIAHELLCAIQQSDKVNQVGDALCKLHDKSCYGDACHPRIEGQSVLLRTFPFFGNQKVHTPPPHWLSIPANALICKDPNIFNLDSTRPGVSPPLVKVCIVYSVIVY
jgi:hypothetical protein